MKRALDLLQQATHLKALTLWQPWAWAIASADKDVENRGWEPPKGLMGQLLAIHAGKSVDEEAAASIRTNFGLPVPGVQEFVQGAVVGLVVVERAVRGSPSRWAVPGAVHWCLGEKLALPRPVPCKGAQGLWAVPPEVLKAIRDQVLVKAESGASATPASESAEAAVRGDKLRLVKCVDCGGYFLGSGPGPHRHGPHRVGRVNCLGVVEGEVP